MFPEKGGKAMIEWYPRTLPWNRIALSGMIAALAAKAILSALTTTHTIGLPTGAAVIWACGWAAIAAWDVVCRQREHSHLLRTGGVRIDNET
jgi:hypothetical protein